MWNDGQGPLGQRINLKDGLRHVDESAKASSSVGRFEGRRDNLGDGQQRVNDSAGFLIGRFEGQGVNLKDRLAHVTNDIKAALGSTDSRTYRTLKAAGTRT